MDTTSTLKIRGVNRGSGTFGRRSKICRLSEVLNLREIVIRPANFGNKAPTLTSKDLIPIRAGKVAVRTGSTAIREVRIFQPDNVSGLASSTGLILNADEMRLPDHYSPTGSEGSPSPEVSLSSSHRPQGVSENTLGQNSWSTQQRSQSHDHAQQTSWLAGYHPQPGPLMPKHPQYYDSPGSSDAHWQEQQRSVSPPQPPPTDAQRPPSRTSPIDPSAESASYPPHSQPKTRPKDTLRSLFKKKTKNPDRNSASAGPETLDHNPPLRSSAFDSRNSESQMDPNRRLPGGILKNKGEGGMHKPEVVAKYRSDTILRTNQERLRKGLDSYANNIHLKTWNDEVDKARVKLARERARESLSNSVKRLPLPPMRDDLPIKGTSPHLLSSSSTPRSGSSSLSNEQDSRRRMIGQEHSSAKAREVQSAFNGGLGSARPARFDSAKARELELAFTGHPESPSSFASASPKHSPFGSIKDFSKDPNPFASPHIQSGTSASPHISSISRDFGSPKGPYIFGDTRNQRHGNAAALGHTLLSHPVHMDKLSHLSNSRQGGAIGGERQGRSASTDRTSREFTNVRLDRASTRRISTASELLNGAKREVAGAKDKQALSGSQRNLQANKSKKRGFWNRPIFPTNRAVVRNMPESRKDGMPLRVPEELPPSGFYGLARKWVSRGRPRTAKDLQQGLKSATAWVVEQGNRMRDDIYRFKRDKPRSMRPSRSVPADLHAVFNLAPPAKPDGGSASPGRSSSGSPGRPSRPVSSSTRGGTSATSGTGSQPEPRKKSVRFLEPLPPARTAEERWHERHVDPTAPVDPGAGGGPHAAPRSPRRGATDDELFPHGQSNPLMRGQELAGTESPEGSDQDSPDRAHGGRGNGHGNGRGNGNGGGR